MITTGSMNRELVFEQHIIEAWGLWWVQWQKDTKDRLRAQATNNAQTTMGTRVNKFAELHLGREGLRGNSTAASSANLPN